jgi:hypothetical protein
MEIINSEPPIYIFRDWKKTTFANNKETTDIFLNKTILVVGEAHSGKSAVCHDIMDICNKYVSETLISDHSSLEANKNIIKTRIENKNSLKPLLILYDDCIEFDKFYDSLYIIQASFCNPKEYDITNIISIRSIDQLTPKIQDLVSVIVYT